MEILRTPEERFKSLPGFKYEPKYTDIDNGDGTSLRIAYIDEGPQEAEPVLMLHGEPTWSYLYRKMIPVFTKAGYRAVAPDLVGFGRSDKPSDPQDYSYQGHINWMNAWLNSVDIKNITLFAQDWGGIIGLRLATDNPDRFNRIIASNTLLPTGDEPLGVAFQSWRVFSQKTPVLPVGKIVNGGCRSKLAPDVMSAYNAPFPDEKYKAGARAFPKLVPITPEDPASEANREVWNKLKQWQKPFLTAFSDRDPITQGLHKPFQELIPGARGKPHVTIKNARHFLQEDEGAQLAQITIDFIEKSKITA